MKRYVELICCEAIDDRIMFFDMRETVREFAELYLQINNLVKVAAIWSFRDFANTHRSPIILI
jgi:hypothetical protein